MRYKRCFPLFTAVVFFGLLSVQLSAQKIVGEVFTKADANAYFGDVTVSKTISTADLQALLKKTDTYILFNIIEDGLVILNNKRVVLYPEGTTIPAEQKFKLSSISKVVELIEKGGAENVHVELRNCVLTVSNGEYVLELGAYCPPWCD